MIKPPILDSDINPWPENDFLLLHWELISEVAFANLFLQILVAMKGHNLFYWQKTSSPKMLKHKKLTIWDSNQVYLYTKRNCFHYCDLSF